MADIRAFERDDVPAAVALLRAHMAGWALDEHMLASATVEHPCYDPEIPSLVAVGDEGQVVGFVAAQPRRMQFDGSAIRGVCASDLIVSPDHRSGAPGALLLSRLLAGPQDVTWSDSATDAVVRVWRTVGGGVDHARAADFMLVQRPGRWIGAIVAARARGQRIDRSLVPVGALPVQAAGSLLPRRKTPEAVAGVDGHAANPAEIAEHMPAISSRTRVWVDWDERQLAHAFDLIARLSGTPTCRLVTRRGRPIGWYAYLLRPGGVSRLLHLAAIERAADAVFGDLLEHSTAAGSAVLAGRAEPHLEWPLRQRLATLSYAWQPVIRARDAELAAALATGSSLLTRLDGELSPV